jgi:tetratricopeptide (TPR) repeat protein
VKACIAIFLLLAAVGCAPPAHVGADCFRRGVELYLKKDLEGAREYFSRSIECRDAPREARLFLAKIHYFRGEDALLEPALGSCIEREETKSEALRLKARWHMRRGEQGAARKALDELLARSLEDPVGGYLLGTLNLKEGDHEAAMAAFGRAAGGYGYLKQAHLKMEELCMRLGLVARARKHRALAAAFEEWEKEEK